MKGQTLYSSEVVQVNGERKETNIFEYRISVPVLRLTLVMMGGK